jgi:hypothetical protein
MPAQRMVIKFSITGNGRFYPETIFHRPSTLRAIFFFVISTEGP